MPEGSTLMAEKIPEELIKDL